MSVAQPAPSLTPSGNARLTSARPSSALSGRSFCGPSVPAQAASSASIGRASKILDPAFTLSSDRTSRRAGGLFRLRRLKACARDAPILIEVAVLEILRSLDGELER